MNLALAGQLFEFFLESLIAQHQSGIQGITYVGYYVYVQFISEKLPIG